ncbi:MAG TPA: hypothetical protein VGP47_07380 [Parachlamydiaceae bacterium]|nr:hypothetical protein [Parachlamydiaceae bacterium]
MSTVGEPIIGAITCALQKQQMLALTTAADGSLKVRPLGVIARIWHWNDTKFHEERLSKLAAIIAKVISVQTRLNVVEASQNPPLIAARNLLKDIHYCKVHSLAIDNLEKEVTAAKLGITSEALDNSPGLQKFTESHHLERYLLIYKDAVLMGQASQQVMLRKDGEFHTWNEIAEDVKSWSKSTRSPHLHWVYGSEGIQNKDMYDWTELKPFMKGDPVSWNHQYVFEFCSCFNPDSIKNGNHSWLRLKTPAGDIYSVGLYRPDKMDWTQNLKTPLRIKSGHLMQPDVSEFWNFPISTVDFAITEEIFLKIKETVETDKRNDDQVFQLFNNNCLLYSKKLARLAGVDFPTKINAIYFLAPANLSNKVSTFLDKLPSFVQKVSLFISAFFLNILQMFLGGCMIDKDLNECQRKLAIPHLASFRDLFDVSKSYLNHPNVVGFDAHQQVAEWRKKELDALDEQNSELRNQREREINLCLPPSYYLS